MKAHTRELLKRRQIFAMEDSATHGVEAACGAQGSSVEEKEGERERCGGERERVREREEMDRGVVLYVPPFFCFSFLLLFSVLKICMILKF